MKALVLFSGGLDSTVCLAMAVHQYGANEVLALSVYYGQRHKKELEAAARVARYYGVRQITLDLGEIFKGSSCSLLRRIFPQAIIPNSSRKPRVPLSAPTFPSATVFSFLLRHLLP